MGVDSAEIDTTRERHKLGYMQWCVENHDFESLKWLIKEGIDISEKLGVHTESTLFFAVLNNDVAVTRLLLDSYKLYELCFGGDAENPRLSRLWASNGGLGLPKADGIHILNLALCSSSTDKLTLEMVKLLLERGVASINEAFTFIPESCKLASSEKAVLAVLRENGKYPLIESSLLGAVRQKNSEALDLIMDWPYINPENIFTDMTVGPAIIEACRQDTVIAGKLLSHKLIANVLERKTLTSAFNLAIDAGCGKGLNALLTQNPLQFSNDVCLQSYCVMGEFNLANAVLHNIIPKAQKRPYKYINLAVKGGNCAIVNLIIKELVFGQVDKAQLSKATLYAARHNHDDVLHLLFQMGADSKYVDDFNGRTALHMACMYGSVDVLDMLLKEGCDANKPISGGYTPLHIVCSLGEHLFHEAYSMVTKLVHYGANVNVETDDARKTPLMVACSSANKMVVEYLVKHRADIFMKNHQGQTCFTYAICQQDVLKPQICMSSNRLLIRPRNMSIQIEVMKLLLQRACTVHVQHEVLNACIAEGLQNFSLLPYCFDIFPREVVISWAMTFPLSKIEIGHIDSASSGITTANIIKFIDLILNATDDKDLFFLDASNVCTLMKLYSCNPYILTFTIQKCCGLASRIHENVLDTLLMPYLWDIDTVRLLFDCGFDIVSGTVQAMTQYFNPSLSTNICEIDSRTAYARALISEPVMLQNMCRNLVRRQLFNVSDINDRSHSTIQLKIEDLPLPKQVQSFLKFQGCY